MAKDTGSIKGQSYANKDFNSIYSELLDLVKVLTNKWDPSISNESDPGVVLIKLGALLSDKDNYNIDKNILEAFPQSVTQYGNARKIYDLLGYTMSWYKSATTYVTFSYQGSDETPIQIQAMDTMVSDDSEQTIYTVVESISVSSSNRTMSARCIQGVPHDYTLNGSYVIKLDNLDEYNRLYFNEKYIAENGIFIENYISSTLISHNYDWEKVNNLSSESLGRKVYKFGVLPNSDTCYIEFPQDIATLIGDGLSIKYIITDGENGNVSANTLTKFYNCKITSGSKDVTDDIRVFNVYSTTDGANYEDINSAYNNYKKTVGTFNTLVTCKDYETATQEVTLGGAPLCSNSVVSDRTNDVNNTTYIVTKTVEGHKKNLVKNDNFDAFSLALYLLAPMSNIINSTTYNKSFSVNTDTNLIQSEIENYKSVQHDYYDTTPTNPIPYIYKNIYKLTGAVTTYSKVSPTDADEIENNIRRALYSNFNASKVTFGEEPSYEKIIDTIYSADSRIKYVMLNQPEYVVRVMQSDDVIGSPENASQLTPDEKLNLLAKMILSGNIQYLKFDKDFNYELNQSNAIRYDNVSKITTGVSISVNSISSGYTLKKNENVILYTDNLITTTQYVLVNYELSGFSSYPTANVPIRLSGEQEVKIKYTDSDSKLQERVYKSGDIVKFNFDVKSISGYLSSGEEINILEENSTTLDNGTQCLWFTNTVNGSGKYVLFGSGESTRILQNNEYFIYTNKNRNELVILSSGTMLTRNGSESLPEVSVNNTINMEDVTSDGQSAIDESDWFVWVNSQNGGNLSVKELKIVTLGEGSVIQGTVAEDVTNTATTISEPKYKSSSEEAFKALSVPIGSWQIMSRLNLDMSPSNAQYIGGNQTVSITYTTSETATITNKYLLSNIAFTLSGGENIDVSTSSVNGVAQKSLSLYTYEQESESTISRQDDSWLKVELKTTATSYSLSIDENSSYIIPIYKSVESSTITITTNKDTNIQLFNKLSDTTFYKSIKITGSGIYYIRVKSSDTITLTTNSTSETILIGKLYKVYNNSVSDVVQVTLSSIGKGVSDLETTIESIPESNTFDYTYEVDPSDELDFTPVKGTAYENNAFAPKMFWDINHIANRFTIAQFDSINSSINVTYSSKL